LNIFKIETDTQKHTLYGSILFVSVFLAIAFLFPELFIQKLSEWTYQVLEVFGISYLILGLGSVGILLALAFSPFGNVKLGKEKAEYSWISWIAMLYSTGMGGGLLLRAVQEPVFYYSNPPRPTSLSAGEFALEYTFFHWGFTPWGIYALFGLVIGYNLYQRNGSILSSSILIGIYKKTVLATLLDFITIVCTVIAVVAGVGLGSRQLLDAISFWMGIDSFPASQSIWLVVLVCLISTFSAFLGVNRGIKIISNLNIGLASLLLIFTWIVGSEWMVFGMFFNALGTYLWEFIPMSLNIGDQKVSHSFLTDWTYFYWAFWLAWAPFTGVFIARISKGRTIRQFVFGTMIIPALGTFVWFSVFGSNAFRLIEIGKATSENFSSIYSAIFNFYQLFTYSGFGSMISTILVFTFLITSVDSAIYVLSMFTDEGKPDPKRRYRVFWGIAIGLVTIVVIMIGKDQLLQSISQLLILFALPFGFMFVGMVLYFVNRLIKLEKKK
jgi:glycine betaine transporter